MIGILESILFAVGEEGLDANQIANILEIDEEEVLNLINDLNDNYNKEDRGINIKKLGNKYKLVTKEINKDYIKKLGVEVTNNLSEAALETLAIIAYNEPITRLQIDEIRGINSSQMIRNLIAKGLVLRDGKSDLPGKPTLYRTTDYFLDYFNLSSKDDLPEIDEIEFEVLEDDDLYKSKYKEE